MCYDEENVLTCKETENHTHGERCYGTWELACGKEEHTHNLVCKSDPEADVETDTEWTATFADVTLTGEWAVDVVNIAKTQLGYTESPHNYAVMEDGATVKGYTRYGAWYGDPYRDWNTLFAMFCLHYGGVQGIPVAENGQQWLDELIAQENGSYRQITDAQPGLGQLVFLSGEPIRVGIVHTVEQDEAGVLTVTVIEGDADGEVLQKAYGIESLLGYVDLAEVQTGFAESHVHTEDCYTLQLNCTWKAHGHDENCYNPDGSLICQLDPEEVHEHSDACYEKVLTCTINIQSKETYLCGLQEHVHDESCLDETGGLTCGLEEHSHFVLCIDPDARIYCRLTEHTHEESCRDENDKLICGLYEHTHIAGCCDLIGSLVIMIDTLPTSEQAETILLAYEESQDWDGYAAYRQKIADLAWPLYYDCEELDEEDLLLVTNYDRLMDLAWLWSTVSYALPEYSPYYPMDGGEWITDISADNEFYDYVHVNEAVPDEYTVDGLVLGAKRTDACEPSFTPVFTSSLEGLTEEECINLTGYSWNTLNSAGLDNTYGANLILPANSAGHDALRADKKTFVVYRNVGTYKGDIIHLLVQIVNYKPYEDDEGVIHDGILGFYSNGYIGVAVCGVEWVKLQYNFIEDKDIAEAVERAKNGESLTGLRRTIKGSTSFYDIDYSQAVHLYGSDGTPWTEMLTGIYVTDVTSSVPDLRAIDALTGNTAKRDYFRNWPQNDCVLKIGTVDDVYSSWTGPAIYSPHPYDAADEDWRTDSKHGATVTFDHTWFYMNYSFNKGRNADGGIRHFGEPVSRGSLTIEKEVTGTNVTPDKEFEFQITFHKQKADGSYVADDALNGTYGGVVLTKGVGTFKLKDGDSVTISNIPIRQHGTHYRVTELGYDGYIVETSMSQQVKNEAQQSLGPYTQDYFESSIQPDSAMAQRQTVVFENYGGPVLPNTGGMGTTVHTIAGVALMLFSLVCLLPRRRIHP